MEYRVYAVSDATEEELALWLTECSEEKRQRLLQMRREEDRRRSLCADHLARQMLSERCGIPRDHLQILRDERGKPFAKDSGLQFNLSHAGNFAACAVDTAPVGIDIEVPRPLRPSLCRKVCTAEELAFVHPAGSFSPERFLQLWTAKEAFLKQSGTGILRDLTSVSMVQDGQLAYPAPLKGVFLRESAYFLSIAYT